MTERLSAEDMQEEKDALLFLELHIRRMALFVHIDNPTPRQQEIMQRKAGLIDGEIRKLISFMPPIKEVSGK